MIARGGVIRTQRETEGLEGRRRKALGTKGRKNANAEARRRAERSREEKGLWSEKKAHRGLCIRAAEAMVFDATPARGNQQPKALDHLTT